jgi:hypothetical protein
MNARLDRLRKHPVVSRAMMGVSPDLFDTLPADVLPALDAADSAHPDRDDSYRPVGAGHPPGLTALDRILLAVVWLWVSPTHAVIGYLFGLSETAARRLLGWSLPVLGRAGKETMRMPDPGEYGRQNRPGMPKATPRLAVLIDTS